VPDTVCNDFSYGLRIAGLSDAGSFDTQMAHLFKGIADRASGQVLKRLIIHVAMFSISIFLHHVNLTIDRLRIVTFFPGWLRIWRGYEWK
jgi:hypothetical protein